MTADVAVLIVYNVVFCLAIASFIITDKQKDDDK